MKVPMKYIMLIHNKIKCLLLSGWKELHITKLLI